MTIRSISAIGAICGFVRYVSTTMIVRLRMNKPVIVVGSLQSHAVVVYLDRGGVLSLHWYNGFRASESI